MTFEEFVVARLPALLRYAAVLTGEAPLAQDVVQEVLARAQVRWSRIASAGSPEAYVRRMIVNEYLSWRRSWPTRRVHAAGDDLEQIGNAQGVDADHAQAVVETHDLRDRLARLPRRQRAVIVLRYYEDLGDDEIARILGCAQATVRSHASKALHALRLDPDDDPPPVPLAAARGTERRRS